MSDGEELAPLERVPTGIPGFDAVLRGGLLQGGCYLVLGRPGAGKTILGSQMAFRTVAAGGHALYLTLLTESHARLLAHLNCFSFFDPGALAKSFVLVSGYQELEKEGLKGLLVLIRRMVKDNNSSFLVVDGIATAGSSAESEIELKKFIYELKVFVEMAGCTVLLLTGSLATGAQYPAQTMVDGIIELTLNRIGMRLTRELEVTKLRGSSFLEGSHSFQITGDGLVIHPRIEAAYEPEATTIETDTAQIGFGIASLDSLLGGGVGVGSSTLVLGTPGSGKTLLGLQFLAQGAENDESGIYLGFSDKPARIVPKAAGIGIDMAGYVERGTIQLVWKGPFELIGDQVAEELLDNIRSHSVKRVVLDGIEGFIRAHAYPDRAIKLLAALTHQLTALGVTALFTQEAFPMGQTLDLPRDGQTGLADNILLLRYVEQRALLRRLISVLKKREGSYDTTLHEFRISNAGIEVGSAFTGDRKATSRRARAKRKRR